MDRCYLSSQQCRVSKHINSVLQLSDRLFHCPKCWQIQDRDLLLAIN
ncbi:zinc ribbon domain-containing protein [Ancylothrix sp. D3o]